MTPFHLIGNWLRELLLLVPLGAVRALFLFFLLALLIWVLRLPRPQPEPGMAGRGLGANLKIWAALALLIQLVIYTFL